MRKKIVSMVVATAFLMAVALPVFAQTASSTADLIKQLQAQIQALQAQIATLQKAQQATQEAAQDVRETLRLLNQLREGVTSEDVKLLQTTLAADPEVYPEGLITGFYGKLTTKAVRLFQKKHNLEQVGNVGPKTLAKLNEKLNENPVTTQTNASGEKEICAIVPPGHLVASGWLKKNDGITPIVPTCQTIPPGIAAKIGTATTTTASNTTAPIISSVVSSEITSTGAVISWTTDKFSKSKAYYGTTSPLVLSTALTATNNLMVKNHALNLVGLTASTTYYYIVESKDAANNTTTSNGQSFTTLP